MNIPLELFVMGIALGASQCVISCAPILGLYVAGTREGWRDSLRATLIFSLSRLFAYVLLGLLAGLFGDLIVSTLKHHNLALYLWVAAGAFISLVGIIIIWGKEPHLHFCQVLTRHTVNDSIKSMALLGLIIGITPCAPLLAVLSYIATTAKSALVGAFYAFCFGLGPAIITPIIILGIVAGVIPKTLFKTPRTLDIFRRACGFLLLLLGARLLISVLVGL